MQKYQNLFGRFTSSKKQNVFRRSLYCPGAFLRLKGQRSRTWNCLNNFLAIAPSQMVRFNSSKDNSVPILGAGMLAMPRIADFLILVTQSPYTICHVAIVILDVSWNQFCSPFTSTHSALEAFYCLSVCQLQPTFIWLCLGVQKSNLSGITPLLWQTTPIPDEIWQTCTD